MTSARGPLLGVMELFLFSCLVVVFPHIISIVLHRRCQVLEHTVHQEAESQRGRHQHQLRWLQRRTQRADV